MHFSRLLTS